MNSVQEVPRAGGARSWRLGHTHGLNILILLVLITTAFGWSVHYDFVWDDVGLIVRNPQIKSMMHTGDLVFRSFWALGQNVEDPTRSFYRPLISLSYAIDYQLWGLEAAGFHLTNLLWHAGAAIMVYILAALLLHSRPAALLAAALFAIHPTHVENVGWIAGRTDLLCTAFYLCALLGFILFLRKPASSAFTLPLCVLAYFAALLSKETAVTFPLLAAVCQCLLYKEPGRRIEKATLWALLLLVTVIYFGLRAVVLGTAIAPAAFGTPLERVLSLPIIFAKYIGSLFSLLPIDPHHPDGFVSTFTDPRLWIGSVICLLYAGLIYRAARSGLKTFVFFLLWIPVTLAPTFKLGSFGDVLRADRFLYLPSAGFALLAALAGKYFIADRVEPGSLPRRLCAASLLVIVGAWITLSIAHGRIWRNNVSLFSHASRTSPDSAYIVFNLGNSRFETGNFKGASDAYARAIRLDPTYREAYANRGIALARMGLFREALDHYRKAWELGDHSALLLSSTADLYRQLGDVERAVTWYELSLAAAPTPEAHNNLGECLLALDEFERAELHFRRALQQQPRPEIYNNLALAAIRRNEHRDAVRHLEQALTSAESIDPAVELAIHYNFARALTALGQPRDSIIYHARRALALAGDGPLTTSRAEEIAWLREVLEGGAE